MKFVFQTMKKYWLNHLLTTLVFTISTLVITTFTSLFFSALSYDQKTNQPVFLFFLILLGVSYLLSWFLTTQILKLNFKIRFQEIKNLRFLGLSFSKNYFLLLKEFSLILILPLIIGLTCSSFLENNVIQLFQNQEVITNEFQVNHHPLIYLAVIILTWLLICWVTYSTIHPVKKHFATKNANQKTAQKKTIIWSTIFGVLIIACFGLLISFFQTAVLYLFGGIIFLIGFSLAGPTLMKIISASWKFCTKKSSWLFLGASRFHENLFKILVLLGLGILIFSLANFSFNGLGQTENQTPEIEQNIWGRALNLVAMILSFIVCLFGLIVILATSYLYFDSFKQNNQDLFQLGVKKSQIYFLNLTEGLMISGTILIVSLIPSLLVDLIYQDFAAIEKIWLWLGLSAIVSLPNLMMPLICVGQALRFSRKKSQR